MTNLDSILKSRDITLPTKVSLVKAMVFPVVLYGCESWTIRKAEHRRIDALNCGIGEDSWESLGLQGDPTSPSSVVPFSSCPQSFPASGSFQMSPLFPSGGQSIGVSASASVIPMNIQDWFPLGWTGWNSLQPQGFSQGLVWIWKLQCWCSTQLSL